jgi:serine phosphatase RsbU (regulator of sigma subunit)/putative methionine-R-sulfoxide reductase with GAF domain
VTRAPQSPETLAALQRVTDAALAYLSLDELLTELLHRTTEILDTDTAAFLLLDDAGDTLVARAAKGIEEEVEQGVRIPVGRGFAGRIAAERRAITIEDVDHADILNPILRERGIRSLLGVPLLVEGDVIGVLHVGTLTPRYFTAGDQNLLQLAADRAGLAIQHARLYAQEQEAHREAAATARRLEALQRVTDAALAYLSLDELLTELLHRMTEILDTDTAAFLLLDDAGDTLVARAAKGIEEEVEQGVRIPVGRGFAGRIAAERHAITIDDVDHADILNPILRERGIRSLLGVPLLVEGDVIGVLHVGTLTPRQFTAGDQDLLQLAADRAALAIQNARLFHDRRVVESLQRMLITDALPTLPGLELAGRYRPAAGRSIGGDWYDAFVLSRGEVALVIGDVMGHGIAAAALMAQVRTGLRAYALDGHSPAGVTERLNRLALSLGPNEMTTLAYGVVDVDRRRLRTISAGHVPPLVRDAAGGEVTVLPVEGDPPLGVSPDTRYREHAFELSPGSTVVLVTDGAIEVRGEGLDRGLERVRDLVVAHDDLVGLCDAIARGDARGEPAEDDVAVLAARVTD